MAGSKGYYSLIQYCPDRSRLEVANVGVLLYCPEMHFLRPHMSKGNDRVRRIFGATGDDLSRIELAKTAIAERIEYEERRQPDLDAVHSLIQTRANDMILTPLRPMKITDPERNLVQLYKELVGERERQLHEEKRTVIPELDRAMQNERIHEKVRRNLVVQLPITERQFHFPYAYQNGMMNYIQPERFSHTRKETLRRASDLAMVGSLLSKHPDDNGIDRKLIVVPSFTDESLPAMPALEALFNEFSVRFISLDHIDDLVKEILHSAH